MSRPILRPYQIELVDEIEMSFTFLYEAPLVVLPTGGGKTVVFCQIVANRVDAGQRVWIVAHRQELIAQASGVLKDFGIRHGIIKAGVTPNPGRRVQVASVQTLTRRVRGMEPPDLIIIDECHHSTAPSYRRIFNTFPRADLFGVTATPCRLNGAGLNAVFDTMILGPTNTVLTEAGFLSPARYYAPPKKADFSKVRISKGDYERHELEVVMDEDSITGDAVEHYKRLCDGVPMLVFCVSVAHAHHVAEQYRAAGYRAAAVDGAMSDEDRKDRIGGLGTGNYQIITSCDLIGEGLDVPIVTAAQLLRPTQSPALHLQQIGRVLRPCEGKESAIVLDHVGNTAKHGFASTDFQWSLEGLKKKGTSEATIATRTCPECYSVHKVMKSCPYCGFEYPVKPRTMTSKKVIDGQLVEVEQTKEERQAELKNTRSLKDLIALAKARGYKRPAFWARKIYFGRSYTHLMP